MGTADRVTGDRALLGSPPDGLMPLHRRQYDVEAYIVSDEELLVRGAIRDLKLDTQAPADQEPELFPVHHMVVELRVAVPSMLIKHAGVEFQTFPHDECPRIASAYEQLEGHSIVRGFRRTLDELVAGPQGCAHVLALLQAMAPAAVQAGYALSRFVACQRGELADTIGHGPVQTPTGTCHVWSENAELPSLIAAGGTVSVPTRETVIWAPLRPSPTDVPAIDQR